MILIAVPLQFISCKFLITIQPSTAEEKATNDMDIRLYVDISISK